MSRLELLSVRALSGANLWAPHAVLEASLGVDAGKQPVAGLPARIQLHFQSAGIAAPPELSFSTVDQGLMLAEQLAQAAIALQTAAGTPVSFCKAKAVEGAGVYRLALQYEEEGLAEQCLEAARDLCQAALDDQPFDLSARIADLKTVAENLCLGPNTRAIFQAAVRLGIPVRRLNDLSLLQLGHGVNQRRMRGAETELTGAIAKLIAWDKPLTKQLLQSVGVPVPEGRLVSDEEDAWRTAVEFGLPAVVKPQSSCHGIAVFIGLTEKQEVIEAYRRAKEEGGGVLVERCITGAEHRVLIVGDSIAAATRGDALYLNGDGTHTVTELVAEINLDPRRGEAAECPLAPIDFDGPNLASLAKQGYTPDSVIPAGERVLLQRNGNLAIDVTDQVHPDNLAIALLAARTVGLDVAGIDMVIEDIGKPIREQGGAILEVNAMPGLMMHLEPGSGQPRQVGEIIVQSVVPKGTRGRIPLIAVNDGPAAAATARMIYQLLAGTGLRIGLISSEGTFVDGAQVASPRESIATRTAALLLHPMLEAAVIETCDDRVETEGLGFDLCQVAVIADASATASIDARRVLLSTVDPGGSAVVHGAFPALAAITRDLSGELILFAEDESSLASHRRQGGRVVFHRGGRIVAAALGQEQTVLDEASIAEWRESISGLTVEGLLAAVAATWGLRLKL